MSSFFESTTVGLKGNVIHSWGIRVLVFFFWSAPFLVARHTLPIPTFYAELLSMAIVSIIFFATLMVADKSRNLFLLSPIAIVPLGFSLVIFLQLAVMHLGRPVAPFFAIFFAICCILSAQAGCWLGRDQNNAEEILRAVAAGCVIGALLSAAFAWVQAFGLEGHYASYIAVYSQENDRRLFANLFQPNHLGTLCILGMVSALYLYCTRKLSVISLLVILGGLAVGVALSASRTALLQIGMISVGAFVFARTRGKLQHSQYPSWHVVAIGVAPLIMQLAAILLVSWLDQTFSLHLSASSVQRLGGDGETSSRIGLWHYALKIFSQHPWLGVGWGEYVWAQYLIADQLGPVGTSNSSHNLILDLMAKTGILGASAVLIPLALWCRRSFRAITDDSRGVQHAYALAVIAVVGLHAMLEFPQNYAFFLLPSFFLMGILDKFTITVTRRPLVIGVGLMMGIVVCGGLVAGYYDYKKAEALYQDQSRGGTLNYTANPALIFGDWARAGLVAAMEVNSDSLVENIALQENSLTLAVSPYQIRRYIILLALANEEDKAFLQVERLRSYSFRNFKREYIWLLEMCDKQGSRLSGFKARLMKSYDSFAMR